MQYRKGSVVVINGSQLVVGTETTNWTGLSAGCLFSVKGSGVFYSVSSFALVAYGSLSLYAAGTTYAIGDRVRDGSNIMYVSLVAGNVGHTPSSSPTYWAVMSGWTATLSANYSGASEWVAYSLTVDFSTLFSLPLLSSGDVESGAVYSRSIALLDQMLGRTINGVESYDFRTALADATAAGTVVEININNQYDGFMVEITSRGKVTATTFGISTANFHCTRDTSTVVANSFGGTNNHGTGGATLSHSCTISGTKVQVRVTRSATTGATTIYSTVRIVGVNTQRPASGNHPLLSSVPWIDRTVTPPLVQA